MAEEKANYYPNCDENIWLRSCKEEIIEPKSGKTTGEIPKWLKGSLIRNGSGSLEVGDYTFKHLFDGASLLHRFGIKDGNVTYQCRFLQSETYKRNKKANRIVTTEFGTKAVPDPCQTIFQRASAVFNWERNVTDNSMISVYPFGDELYAFGETPFIHRIHQETLETEEKVDVNKHVAIVSHTSHPHVEDGNVYNLAMSIGIKGSRHHIVHFPPTNKEHSMFEQAKIVATIPARWPLSPSYMHTFGITKNYFIIVEQPLNLSVPSYAVKLLKNEPVVGALQWNANEMTQFNVISRETGKLTNRFYSASFCYFHIINQYEVLDDYLVLDVCSYNDASLIECMYVENMKNMHKNPDYAKMFRSSPIRFVLPLRRSGVKDYGVTEYVDLQNCQAKASLMQGHRIFLTPEKLCELAMELPTIHYEKYRGREYRFCYGQNADVDAENPVKLIKLDTCNKTTLTWSEKNCYPSEPIFVPKPDAQDEDDGIVLTAAIWEHEANRVGLIVLDAKSFLELGRAEFTTSSPVPKSLHGWFLPEPNEAL